jgi:hypothetical protein
MWNPILVHLETELALVQDRCTCCTKRTIGLKSRFGPFRDDVSIGAREVHSLRQTYHRLQNRFGHTRLYSEVMRVKWVLVLVRLEKVLILMQDRCKVCVKHTIGLEIILDTPDGILR